MLLSVPGSTVPVMASEARFFGEGPAGEAYAFNRDSKNREDVRELCESLWAQFRPYCADPGHFLTDAREHFHARAWEMILACGLLSRGFQLERPPAEGPDVKLIDGPVAARWPIWVEATIATLGRKGHADYAGRIEHPFTPERASKRERSARYAWLTLKPDKTTLRMTAAVAAKRDQHNEFMKRGIVKPDEVYVVAINGAELDDYSSRDDDPTILKAVYPIGEAYVAFSPGRPDSERFGHHYRDSVTKAGGTEIPTTTFIDGTAAGVSALLYSVTSVWNANPRALALDFMLTIHNATAANPLPPGTFPFGNEWVSTPEAGQWVRHARDPVT